MNQHQLADQLQRYESDKRAWENAIQSYNGGDPLDIWFNFICWLEQHKMFDKDGGFRKILEQCLSNFENFEAYKQDVRMVKLWMKFIDMQANPLNLYQFLYKKNVGTQCACFYIGWAHYYDAANAFKQAESIYNLGIQVKAQPIEELQEAQNKFRLSLAQRMLYNDASSKKRSANALVEQRQQVTSLSPPQKKLKGETGDYYQPQQQQVQQPSPQQQQQSQHLQSPPMQTQPTQTQSLQSQSELSQTQSLQSQTIQANMLHPQHSEPQVQQGKVQQIHQARVQQVQLQQSQQPALQAQAPVHQRQPQVQQQRHMQQPQNQAQVQISTIVERQQVHHQQQHQRPHHVSQHSQIPQQPQAPQHQPPIQQQQPQLEQHHRQSTQQSQNSQQHGVHNQQQLHQLHQQPKPQHSQAQQQQQQQQQHQLHQQQLPPPLQLLSQQLQMPKQQQQPKQQIVLLQHQQKMLQQPLPQLQQSPQQQVQTQQQQHSPRQPAQVTVQLTQLEPQLHQQQHQPHYNHIAHYQQQAHPTTSAASVSTIAATDVQSNGKNNSIPAEQYYQEEKPNVIYYQNSHHYPNQHEAHVQQQSHSLQSSSQPQDLPQQHHATQHRQVQHQPAPPRPAQLPPQHAPMQTQHAVHTSVLTHSNAHNHQIMPTSSPQVRPHSQLQGRSQVQVVIQQPIQQEHQVEGVQSQVQVQPQVSVSTAAAAAAAVTPLEQAIHKSVIIENYGLGNESLIECNLNNSAYVISSSLNYVYDDANLTGYSIDEQPEEKVDVNPSGIRLPINFCREARSNHERWDVPLCLEEPYDSTRKCCYPKGVVYPDLHTGKPTMEFSLEEIRARKWYRRKEELEEQKKIKQQQLELEKQRQERQRQMQLQYEQQQRQQQEQQQQQQLQQQQQQQQQQQHQQFHHQQVAYNHQQHTAVHRTYPQTNQFQHIVYQQPQPQQQQSVHPYTQPTRQAPPAVQPPTTIQQASHFYHQSQQQPVQHPAVPPSHAPVQSVQHTPPQRIQHAPAPQVQHQQQQPNQHASVQNNYSQYRHPYPQQQAQYQPSTPVSQAPAQHAPSSPAAATYHQPAAYQNHYPSYNHQTFNHSQPLLHSPPAQIASPHPALQPAKQQSQDQQRLHSQHQQTLQPSQTQQLPQSSAKVKSQLQPSVHPSTQHTMHLQLPQQSTQSQPQGASQQHLPVIQQPVRQNYGSHVSTNIQCSQQQVIQHQTPTHKPPQQSLDSVPRPPQPVINQPPIPTSQSLQRSVTVKPHPPKPVSAQGQPIIRPPPPVPAAKNRFSSCDDFEEQIEASTIRFSTSNENGTSKSKTITIKFKKEKAAASSPGEAPPAIQSTTEKLSTAEKPSVKMPTPTALPQAAAAISVASTKSVMDTSKKSKKVPSSAASTTPASANYSTPRTSVASASKDKNKNSIKKTTPALTPVSKPVMKTKASLKYNPDTTVISTNRRKDANLLLSLAGDNDDSSNSYSSSPGEIQKKKNKMKSKARYVEDPEDEDDYGEREADYFDTDEEDFDEDEDELEDNDSSYQSNSELNTSISNMSFAGDNSNGAFNFGGSSCSTPLRHTQTSSGISKTSTPIGTYRFLKKPESNVSLGHNEDSMNSTVVENSYFQAEQDEEAKRQRKEKALAIIETHMNKPFLDPFNSELCKAFLTKIDFPTKENATIYKVVNSNLPKLIKSQPVSLGGTVYNIEKEVGRGSYGSVFRALNTQTGAVVAIKYQKPANTWELYICNEVRRRVRNTDILPGFMDICSAVIAPNASVLVSEFSQYGSLLDINNKIRTATTKVMHESLVMHFSSQILAIVEYLHECNIIHADIKPDNFLLMQIPTVESDAPTLRLIDFGCAIDMNFFEKKRQFKKVIQTDGFTCVEMQEGRPWSFQTDLFCVAGTIHVMLFGEYMQLTKSSSGWDIKQKLPRYLKKHVWSEVFQKLLNIKDINHMPKLGLLKELIDGEAFNMESELVKHIRTLSNLLKRR